MYVLLVVVLLVAAGVDGFLLDPALQGESVRAAIVAAMDEFKVKDANGVVRMIAKRKKDFKGWDRCWLIEKGLLENLSGESAAARVQQLLLSKFPAADREITEAACLAEVQKIISSDGFCMLPFTEQATVKFAATLVQAVENASTKLLKVANVSESSVVLWQACSFFVGIEATPAQMLPLRIMPLLRPFIPLYILSSTRL